MLIKGYGGVVKKEKVRSSEWSSNIFWTILTRVYTLWKDPKGINRSIPSYPSHGEERG